MLQRGRAAGIPQTAGEPGTARPNSAQTIKVDTETGEEKTGGANA